MRTCKNCGIDCIGSDHTCPICGAQLGQPGNTPYAYPVYRIKKHIAKKILLILSLSAILIMAFINYFSWEKASHAWAVEISIGILLIWMICSLWISNRPSIGAKLFTSSVILLVIITYIDVLMDFKGWSTSYVIPTASCALTITLTILTMAGRRNYSRFFSYMTISVLICLLSPLLYVFSLAKIKWLCMLPLLCAVICFLSLAIIRKRDMKRELGKRFRL